MNVSVGLIEGQTAVEVELTGTFTDTSGKLYSPGRYRFTSEVTLTTVRFDPLSSAFAWTDVTSESDFIGNVRSARYFVGQIQIIRRERA